MSPPLPKFVRELLAPNNRKRITENDCDPDMMLHEWSCLAEQIYVADSSLSPKQAYERAVDWWLYELWFAEEICPQIDGALYPEDDEDDDG
jgi:hypothetical protein